MILYEDVVNVKYGDYVQFGKHRGCECNLLFFLIICIITVLLRICNGMFSLWVIKKCGRIALLESSFVC